MKRHSVVSTTVHECMEYSMCMNAFGLFQSPTNVKECMHVVYCTRLDVKSKSVSMWRSTRLITKSRSVVFCAFTPKANWATKSPEVIHFLWARATKATQASNATSGKRWATSATKKSWRRLNFMQITMTRFSGQTLTANRNVDALRLRGSQGTPNTGTLVPIYCFGSYWLYKMSTEKLIVAVTGHRVLYDPSLFHFRDRNKKGLAWASRVVGWSVCELMKRLRLL